MRSADGFVGGEKATRYTREAKTLIHPRGTYKVQDYVVPTTRQSVKRAFLRARASRSASKDKADEEDGKRT